MQWRDSKRRHLCHAVRIRVMLCCGRRKEGREAELAASPRRQQPGNQAQRTKDPPAMVIQGDFRKVSGISTEIFRQIEQVENEIDSTTAAALESVERRGEMVVRILDPRNLSRGLLETAKRFLQLQDTKYVVQIVEIVKRPGQTLGLYIREGNGMDRGDGVFISRIALESAVYNSGCLQVGDEILAVNMVDVTRMSLDDVVIIMSIPRRLVLATRQRKGARGGMQGQSPLLPSRESKPPPVVVIKKHFNELEQDENDVEDRREREREREQERMRDRERERERHLERERERRSRSRAGMGYNQDHLDHNGYDLYYNSRPSEMASSADQWSYRPPPPPVITEQPKPQHFTPYDRQYPKTLESLAEKVHSFYPGGSLRRGAPGYSSMGAGGSHDTRRVGNRIMPRSGSDQHLPRVEYDYPETRLTSRQGSSSMLRSGLKSNTLGHSGYTSRFTDPNRGYAPAAASLRDGSLSRRSRAPLDYSSDTEATIGRTFNYYQRRGINAANSQAIPRVSTGVSSLRSNSLPRDHSRGGRTQLGPVSRQSLMRYERGGNMISGLLDDDSDGALSAPELPSRRDRTRIPSSPSVFTSDEYRAWLSRVPSLLPRSTSLTRTQGISGISRTPSTSAIYERIRAGREAITQQRAQRFTFSADNLSLLDRYSSGDSAYYSSYRGGHLSSSLDRPRPASTTPISSGQSTLRSTSDFRDKSSFLTDSTEKSIRRMRQLLDMDSGTSASSRISSDPRTRLLDINPAEFLKYKVDKTSLHNSSSASSLHSHPDVTSNTTEDGVYGLLWVHLLAGRGLRTSSTQSIGNTTSNVRDLYCVLECDRVHKARTVVRTGDIVFDWDETFELDLIGNRELDLLIYSWDPQYRHKLCYKGSVHLVSLLKVSPVHQLALKIEPRGTLYLRLRYTNAQETFKRKPSQPHIIVRPGAKTITTGGLFGGSLESTVNRENLTSGVPGSIATSQIAYSVPLIIKRCVEEIERRGLDIIGLYRLCGSATKKRILRESFERNVRTVDLTPDNVPDINVITGVLKDYLRELPEPLFTKCLYQMLTDVISVCLQDDPEGNAKLIFSILDCLPKVNRATLIYIMDHLSLVVSQCDRNKMTAQNISVIFGPILMLHAELSVDLDFNQPITVLKYLLEVWKHQSVRDLVSSGAMFKDQQPHQRHITGASLSTQVSGSTKPQPLPVCQTSIAAIKQPLGQPTKLQHGPVVVTSPGSPTSESSRSSSSISPTEELEVYKSSKLQLSKNSSKLSSNLYTNKSPSQISLLGSNSSIANKSPSQVSLLGSNSSISSTAKSIPDRERFRNTPSPYGSPNLSERVNNNKSPYGSPLLDRINTSRSPVISTLDRKQPQQPPEVPEKPMFSTLPRQRSIPTIIGLPPKLMEQRKSLPDVKASKNPFAELDTNVVVPPPPSGKNPFLDEDEGYNYEPVSMRVTSFEHQTPPKNGLPTSGIPTTKLPSTMASLQYSVPVSSGQMHEKKLTSTSIREEVSETPTPSSSTGTDSSRKDVGGQEGDVESDADEIEIAEQDDIVPELGSKLF